MKLIDPVEFLCLYLEAQESVPDDAPTGDRTTREAGDVSVYLEHSGGFRAIRDRMERADIEYEVIHPDRESAVKLALTVRNLFLEQLPGEIVGDAEVLDVDEISSPRYFPDSTSREHVYGGEVTVFYVEAD